MNKQFLDSIRDSARKALEIDFEGEEPAFEGLLSTPGLYLKIWRIEKSELKPWPESKFGTFYEGDSFIVLKKKSISEVNAHVWVGKDSSRDETGVASFKLLQLDNYFNKNTNIYYEPQGYESNLFLSYFQYINIIQGGIDEDEEKEKTEQFQPRLFNIRSIGSNVKSKQVPINQKSIYSGDVYLFDLGLILFNWRGKKSNGFEKFHGAVLAERIKAKRNSKINVITIDEGNDTKYNIEAQKEFDNYIKRYEQDYDNIMEIKEGINFDKNFRKMMKLSDEEGNFNFNEEEYSKNVLESKYTFVIDRGDAVVVWIGNKTSKNEKRFARYYAIRYLRETKRNSSLPIIMVTEGKLSSELDKCFNF
jgi:hypothetical protein